MKRTPGGWLTRRSVAPWDDTEPIRAEVFGRERFEQHAVSLADSHMVVVRSLKVVSIVERLDDNASALLQDDRALLTELGKRRAITPAAIAVGTASPRRTSSRVGGTVRIDGVRRRRRQRARRDTSRPRPVCLRCRRCLARRVERIELDGADTTERNGVTPPADGEEHHVHVAMGPA